MRPENFRIGRDEIPAAQRVGVDSRRETREKPRGMAFAIEAIGASW
jgi:hypothetical protein